VRWPQSCPTTKKPVKAVPATNQARGSRYQGAAWMAARQAPMDTMDVATARHALPSSSSNTDAGSDRWTSARVTSSGTGTPILVYPYLAATAARSASLICWMAGGASSGPEEKSAGAATAAARGGTTESRARGAARSAAAGAAAWGGVVLGGGGRVGEAEGDEGRGSGRGSGSGRGRGASSTLDWQQGGQGPPPLWGRQGCRCRPGSAELGSHIRGRPAGRPRGGSGGGIAGRGARGA